MKRLFPFFIILILTRRSTFAQTDSIFIISGEVNLKKCLVSEIDGITFDRNTPPPIVTGVNENLRGKSILTQFALSQNYPNYFRQAA
jgi:hypothetical protein